MIMKKLRWREYDIFPAPTMHVLECIARAVKVPVEMVMGSLLAVVAACLGSTRAIEIKKNYVVKPNLYIVLVAASGSGKTPASRPFFEALVSGGVKMYEMRRFENVGKKLGYFLVTG